jgi:hypothetical protein
VSSLPRSHNIVGRWVPSAGPTGFRLMDRSGRGNHGTLTNMDPASDWVVSEGKGALDFDGANDFIECGSSIRVDLVRCSFSLWLRVKTLSGGREKRYFSLYAGGPTLWRSFSNANISIVHGGTIDLQTSASYSSTAMSHIVCTVSGSSITLFQNGLQIGMGTVSGSFSATGTVRIGSGPDVYLEYADCEIDDLTIYNTALTASEVSEIYRLGRGYGVFPEPDFDEGSAAAFNRRRRVLLTAG